MTIPNMRTWSTLDPIRIDCFFFPGGWNRKIHWGSIIKNRYAYQVRTHWYPNLSFRMRNTWNESAELPPLKLNIAQNSNVWKEIHPWRLIQMEHNHGGLIQIIFLSFHGRFVGEPSQSSRVYLLQTHHFQYPCVGISLPEPFSQERQAEVKAFLKKCLGDIVLYIHYILTGDRQGCTPIPTRAPMENHYIPSSN